MQLVSAASPQLTEMKKSGEEGRKKFTQLKIKKMPYHILPLIIKMIGVFV